MLSPEERAKQIEFLKNMSDEDALQNALDDPDNPPLMEDDDILIIRARDLDRSKTFAQRFKELEERRERERAALRRGTLNAHREAETAENA